MDSEGRTRTPPLPTTSEAEEGLQVQAHVAIELLEAIVADRTVLLRLADGQRERLLEAAGRAARPDPWTKRELARAARRKRKAELRARDERQLSQTGIRQKRAEQFFSTPDPRAAPVLAGENIDRALSTEDAPRLTASGSRLGASAPAVVAAAGEGGVEARAGRTVETERACYICKQRFVELHFFYDSLCMACAERNYAKRSQTADLRGRVALVTGARVKIGYQAAIMMLRAGARVIVTTRFPRDAAARYAMEADFADWGDRLRIHGLDLRHTPSVELFSRILCETETRLDFILNNACQTVRRPAGFYGHLMAQEQLPLGQLSADARGLLRDYETLRSAGGQPGRALGDQAGESPSRPLREQALLAVAQATGLRDPAALSQLALVEEDLERSTHIFPEGALDQDRQQVDLRKRNSWRLALSEVSAVELLEVQLVNAVAPFILNARLKPLMLAVPTRDKHIVNVSAMEGQFYRMFKTDRHPHTNMAKAALNMMTRTSAADYIKDGIHMNSVDTGWVTDEDAAELAERKTRECGFHPPLDIVDGAARICDPIFHGFNTGEHPWGMFLKDYAPTDW